MQLPPGFWKLPLGAFNSQGWGSVPIVDAWNIHVFHIPLQEPKPASKSRGKMSLRGEAKVPLPGIGLIDLV